MPSRKKKNEREEKSAASQRGKKKSCSACVCVRESKEKQCVFSLVVETHEEEKFGAFSMVRF